MDIRRLILLMRQQFWFFAGLTLVFLLAFLLIPEIGKKRVYTSSSKILLSSSSRVSGEDARFDPGNWMANEQTLGELLTSERLLSRIATACNLRSPWQDLRLRVKFQPLARDYVGRVSLFSLSFEDEDAKQAQKLTTVAVDEFVSYSEELSAREFANTRRFLEELVAEAKEKVDDTEEKLLTITSSHSATGDSANETETINDLDSEKRKLRDEQAQLEAELGAVQSYLSGQTSIIPSLMGEKGTGTSEYEASVSEARLKLLELEQVYTSENVQVVQQRAKLAKLEALRDSKTQQIAESISQEKGRILSEKRKQVESIEARMSEIRNRQLSPSEKRQVAKLERQLAMWEENHLALVKQVYQARVVEQGSRRQGAITVLENASPGMEATQGVQRSAASRLALGLPFSIAAAAAVIFGLDLLGASMRLVPKIESALDLPVLAVIPPVDEELQQLWESYKREETQPNFPTLLIFDPPPNPA